MHLFTSIFFALSVILGQSVCASPRTDAENIGEYIFTNIDSAKTKQHVLENYAERLTEQLAEHSVRVVDSERFIEMLPERVIEPWLNLWREDYVAALLERQTPEQLFQTVRLLTVERGENTLSRDLSSRDLQTVIGAATSDEFVDDATTVLSIYVPMLSTGGGVVKKMRQQMPPITESPFLADMLATDGVFSFPNRIYRRDLIASIRNGS